MSNIIRFPIDRLDDPAAPVVTAVLVDCCSDQTPIPRFSHEDGWRVECGECGERFETEVVPPEGMV